MIKNLNILVLDNHCRQVRPTGHSKNHITILTNKQNFSKSNLLKFSKNGLTKPFLRRVS